jgi:hypothetical protein
MNFFQDIFNYVLDVTDVLFLSIVPLLLNTVWPSVYMLAKGIRIKDFWWCAKAPFSSPLYHICELLTSHLTPLEV